MYMLTLTADERKAIDWVGNRYHNGYDLFVLLFVHADPTPHDADWDDERDITFDVPHNVAWKIKDNAQAEDNLWPCFESNLEAKMRAFVDKVL